MSVAERDQSDGVRMKSRNEDPVRTARPPRASMRDVATLAGVSIKTVSRVINDENHVTADTAEKVWNAVRVLRYRPDQQAVGLRRGDKRSRMVGMLLADNPNPFWSEVRWAIERFAVDHDSFVLVSHLDGHEERERRLIEALVRRRVDGLLIATPAPRHTTLIQEQQPDMPVVVVDGLPMLVEADAVMSDVRAGAALGARQLLQHGHHRIAYLGSDSSLHTIRERRRGFCDEIERAGVGAEETVIIEDLDEESAYRRTIELLSRESRPTAILAGQVLVTRGVIKGMRELGLHRETALVSFDDTDMFDLLDPGVTVVAQNPQLIGKTAAERVFRRVEGDTSATEHTLLPMTLIERGSGELRPR